MDKQAVKAQIDVCGNAVAYIANNAKNVVSNEVMWALNQATIALEQAYKKCGEEQ